MIESDPFFAGFLAGVEVGPRAGRATHWCSSSPPTGRPRSQRYRRLALDHRIDGAFLTDMAQNDARVPLLEGPRAARRRCEPGPELRRARRPTGPPPGPGTAHGRSRSAWGTAGSPTSPVAVGLIHTRQRVEVWRSAFTEGRADTRAAGLRGLHDRRAAAAPPTACSQGRRSTPTAVVCANDLMAIGFIARASALGVDVPGEMSVTGFDGLELGAYVRPALTTVATAPRRLWVRRRPRLLLGIIAGEQLRPTSRCRRPRSCRDSLVVRRAPDRSPVRRAAAQSERSGTETFRPAPTPRLRWQC